MEPNSVKGGGKNMSETKGDAELECVRSGKRSNAESNELNGLSNEALIEMITRLQAHNTQLKNILQKKTEVKARVEASKSEPISENYAKRHVLLKLYYIGWGYQGFVAQDNDASTIEHHLFQALEKCCLINGRNNNNYQRCGRTDKGVSAFSQVISIDLKSKLEEPSPDNCDKEYKYLPMINRLLPERIRCYAWAHVGSTVGARFSCTSRTYQYYFPKGNLNIELMKEAARHLIGTHDFRNLCKMDVGNGVTKFHRNVTHADVVPCSASESGVNDYSMYKFVITANAFLWHQIRCIMSVLILVGEKKESPDITKELLDVESNPNKPQYKMAYHMPLIFFNTDYSNTEIKWNTSEADLKLTLKLLRKQWAFHSIKEVMIKDMIDELSKGEDVAETKFEMENLLIGTQSKTHMPLLSREKCPSLEDKIDHYMKRRKIVKVTEDEKTSYMSIRKFNASARNPKS